MPHEMPAEIDQVVHPVAGSGIVPSFSIIKDELINNKNPHLKHTLLYVNRLWQDVIFHHELITLERQFPERLAIKQFLSQDGTSIYGDNYFRGRPTIEHVTRFAPDARKTLFFACGPAITKWQRAKAHETGVELKPRFMEWVHEVMEKLHVDKKDLSGRFTGNFSRHLPIPLLLWPARGDLGSGTFMRSWRARCICLAVQEKRKDSCAPPSIIQLNGRINPCTNELAVTCELV